MKKIFAFSLLFFTLHSSAFAAYDQFHPKKESENSFQIFGRGLANCLGAIAELGITPVREAKLHSSAWPVTAVPRTLHNMVYRGASAANDVFFLPFVAPFFDTTAPLTDGMGLPRYPWQVE